MDTVFFFIAGAGGLLVAGAVTKGIIDVRRANHLREYAFPAGIRARLKRRFPGYTSADWRAVLEGLRQWFEVMRLARGRHVAMPSRAIDEAWHEFILDTERYGDFCDRALGGFLHHRPAEPMRAPRDAQEGIRRAWRLACEVERIDPKRPSRLPALFALDAALGFPGGHVYRVGATPDPDDERKTELEFDAEGIPHRKSTSSEDAGTLIPGCVGDGSGGCGSGGDGGGGCGGD